VSRPVVLDASAILCLLQTEPGAETVEEVLPHAIASTVNVAEVIGKLRDKGMSKDAANKAVALLSLDLRPLTEAQALIAGHLRPITRNSGLSLGDRCCLALASDLNATAYTTEHVWAKLEIDNVEIIQLR
jgi:ribonuclease VapC